MEETKKDEANPLPRTWKDPNWRPCGAACDFCTSEAEARKKIGMKVGEPYTKPVLPHLDFTAVAALPDGGLFFPALGEHDSRTGQMTLRDYFAAKALPETVRQWRGGTTAEFAEKAATLAYEIADAMLKARNR